MHARRVHVVEDREPRVEVAALVVQLVPGRRAKRREQRPCPQRRAADAQHEDVIEGLANPARKLGDAPDGTALLRQVVEPVLTAGAAGANLGLHPGKAPHQLRQLRAREAVFAIEAILQHPSVFESQHSSELHDQAVMCREDIGWKLGQRAPHVPSRGSGA